MAIIIDKSANQSFFEKLCELNITYYKSTDLSFLYAPVNTHPDMQIHFVDDSTAVVAPSAYEHYRKILPKEINLIKGASDPGNTYPKDCAYNIVRLGKKIIGNLLYVDEILKKIYTEKEYEFIDVRQGYTKCNLCVVDSNSVITEDEGLFRVLSDHNINVLKISPGEVRLEHFKHGFIGGASGFLSSGNLGFLGKLSKLSEYEKIKGFISERKVNIIELSQTDLWDFGSILYFKDF